jgi:hypothetical protein
LNKKRPKLEKIGKKPTENRSKTVNFRNKIHIKIDQKLPKNKKKWPVSHYFLFFFKKIKISSKKAKKKNKKQKKKKKKKCVYPITKNPKNPKFCEPFPHFRHFSRFRCEPRTTPSPKFSKTGPFFCSGAETAAARGTVAVRDAAARGGYGGWQWLGCQSNRRETAVRMVLVRVAEEQY